MTSSARPSTWPEWVRFRFRWLYLAIAAALLIVVQDRALDSFASVNDIALVVGIGVVVNVVLAVTLFVRALQGFAPLVSIAGDWVLAGAFVALAGDVPLLVLALVAPLMAAGMLNHSYPTAVTQALGVLAGAGLGLLTQLPIIDPPTLFTSYLPVLAGALSLVIALGLNAYFSTDVTSGAYKQLQKRYNEQRDRIEAMQERTAAIADMAAMLNATLKYDKILDAALNIGRMSLKVDSKKRLVSLVMLFTADEKLRVVNARGMPQNDLVAIFEGKEGILARTLEELVPIVVGEAGETDPELENLKAMSGIQSLLCIPLNAGYDTYGLLLYGSEDANAFDENQIDTLKAIGTQATIALQNAMLYNNILEEKERIIALEESARKALVRDLHDVPTQTMSAVAMRLGIIPTVLKRKPENVVKEVEEIREMAVRATEEIRHVLFTLRPLSLESQGLEASLKQLVEKTEKTYGQRCSLYVEQNAEIYLEKNQQGTIFYLVEEAVNNARKYAQASLVRIHITREGDTIMVRVIDNGKGFDTASVTSNYEKRGSFGMVNMRERADLINASFSLSSAPGKGTRIEIAVPLEDSQIERGDTESRRPPATKLEMAARDRVNMASPR